MPALVVEHHPDLITPDLITPGRSECGALKVEGAHPRAESVREHDRQGCGHRPDLSHHQ